MRNVIFKYTLGVRRWPDLIRIWHALSPELLKTSHFSWQIKSYFSAANWQIILIVIAELSEIGSFLALGTKVWKPLKNLKHRKSLKTRKNLKTYNFRRQSMKIHTLICLKTLIFSECSPLSISYPGFVIAAQLGNPYGRMKILVNDEFVWFRFSENF